MKFALVRAAFFQIHDALMLLNQRELLWCLHCVLLPPRLSENLIEMENVSTMGVGRNVSLINTRDEFNKKAEVYKVVRRRIKYLEIVNVHFSGRQITTLERPRI